ncbi:MAG: DDE-type integrase/transposase/recombinase [Deltaproteobacteria bacterium]|nr:DDE-type integrase/transposase/recombinase [Deltaproteobacteria bacterium]
MDEALRQKIALFRFSVIGQLVNGELAHGELKRKIIELSRRTYSIPGTHRRRIGRGTIEEWLLLYRKHGYKGLEPKKRKDHGCCRSLSKMILEKIAQAKREQPRRSIFLICRDLYEKGVLETPALPISTLYRYLGHLNLKRTILKKEQKRYVCRFANEVWQSDVMHGPWIPILPGEKARKVYLFAILDDASRLVVGANFYPSEKLVHLKHVFREALKVYGVPRKFYVDNGRIYQAHELDVACAKINTVLIYATPYYPQGKGKIERFFKTVRDQFLTSVVKITSLEQLNQSFRHWLAQEYNRRPHSGIENQAPIDRYLSLADRIRRLPGNVSLEELFYHHEKRQVGKDGTFRINNVLYEAPEHLIGKKIDVFFDSDAMERVMVRYQGKSEGYCRPVDYLANSQIKRKPIAGPQLNYDQLFNPKQEDGDDPCHVLA